MGSISILTNPLDTSEVETFAHSGPLIDFLQDRFPAGFGGLHVTLLNGGRLDVADYDTVVGGSDSVVIAISPGFDPVTWGVTGAFIMNAIAGAVVSTAINFAINKFFGPKASKPSQPKALSGAIAASPTYNLNTPTNVARLGQPIPVAYGRNLIVPDLASQPYAWYMGNNQYVGMICCLGQGETLIHEMKLAGTNINSLAPGVIEATTFSPTGYGYITHGQTFGIIESTTGVCENVYTSPEVSDQELLASLGGAFTTNASQWNGTSDKVYAAWFYLDTEAMEYAEAIRAGRQVWIDVDSGPNQGVWPVGFIYHSGNVGAGAEAGRFRKGHLIPSRSWNANGYGKITFSYTEAGAGDEGSGGTIGPFSASPVGTTTTYLQYDLVFPSGCYRAQDSGALGPFEVVVAFVAEPIDDDGVVIGAGITYEYREVHATNTAQRRTLHHAVPLARYQVSARRTSPISDRAQDQSKCYWSGLKSVLGNTFGGQVYGDVTLVALKIKATEGIASDATNRFSVDCTRVLGGVPTRNPIDAVTDIVTNQRYGGKRPLAELDQPRFAELKASWGGDYFDAVFDNETNVWEASQMALQMKRAAPTVSGSVITIVEDKNHVVPAMSFTEDTIKSLKLSFLFSDGDEPDGIEVAYRDPEDNSELYEVYPPTTSNPEEVTGFGCRDRASALAYARQRYLQLTLRRRLATMETEMDAHVIPVGSPIHVTYPRLLGSEPVLFIVNSVTPKDEFQVTVELHRHEPGVFA